MASGPQYHSLRSTRQGRHEEDLPNESPPFPRYDASSVVRNLNNQASVQVSMGKFSEANRVYQVALGILMQTAQGITPITGNQAIPTCMEEEDTAMNVIDENDCDFERSKSCSAQDMSFSKTRLSRMSKSSKLRMASYCGQEINKSSKHSMHHQVFSLPIVMEDSDWERAPTLVHSFVLIFNSAICSHLCGMELLSQQCGDSNCFRSFETARNLYELALNALSDAHSQLETSIFLLGVDKICFPSIFNNLSHVYKTLNGPNCYEAQHYDRLLLRTVFWLLYTTKEDQATLQDPSQLSPYTLMRNALTAASLPNDQVENTSSSPSVYEEEDAEIMNVFLENAFYLIGAPESIVPAAAA